MMKVIWRPYFTDNELAQIERAGTIPGRYETEVDARFVKPHEIIAEVAELEHQNSSGEWFGKSEKMVVLDPPELAGTWYITVDYSPEFHAQKAKTA